MKALDLQESLLFPPINKGKITEIYPWHGFVMDILVCMFYPFNRKISSKEEGIVFDFFKTKNICLVDSGRSALYLALKSLNVSGGDEVIISSFNCPAVVEPILSLGATPKFVDINDFCGIDLYSLKELISEKTKCVISTNIYGMIDDLKSISSICKENNVFFINDLSQVLENPSSSQKNNRFGDISVYSFGPEKHLFAIGGGALIANNKDIFERVKLNCPKSAVSFLANLKTIAKRMKYYSTFFVYRNLPFITGLTSIFGFTYRFSNIKTVEVDIAKINVMLMNSFQKKILIRKLKSFNKIINASFENFDLLKDNIKFSLICGGKMIPLYATILVEEKDRYALSDYLSRNGIITVWNYLPLYKAIDDSMHDYLPNTEKVWKRVLSIPFRYPINKNRIIKICKILNSYEQIRN